MADKEMGDFSVDEEILKYLMYLIIFWILNDVLVCCTLESAVKQRLDAIKVELE